MQRRASLVAAVALTVGAVLSGCSDEPPAPGTDPAQVDSIEAPEVGACRVLDADDIAAVSDATPTVDCAERHTAQTYAAGDLPAELDDAGYDSPELGRFAYDTCSSELQGFLGADVSLSMRTVLTWAWFRPSQDAWDDGARWYRCDVVAGADQGTDLLPLPETAEGVLQGRADDRWLVCVDAETISEAPKIPCSRPHQWRAVTTIKLGEAGDDYPGDQQSEARTKDFCSDSVRAWLNYPVDFDYAYTWFHEAEWDAGNRRSICWAKTPD